MCRYMIIMYLFILYFLKEIVKIVKIITDNKNENKLQIKYYECS